MFDKKKIFGQVKLKRETVHIPEWGGDVIVTELTGKERDAWEMSIANDEGQVSADNVRAKLVARTVINEGGDRIFDDDDVDRLGQCSASILSAIFNVASRLSGLVQGDLEELTKN